MNFESRRREMPLHLEVTAHGDSITVRNHAVGAALTFRNGVVVSREGNFDALTRNNIASMTAEATKQYPTQQAA
jgi:hypothetical protein